MSNPKAITVAQFTSAIQSLDKNSKAIKASLRTACVFITQCETFNDQQAAREILVIAYQSLESELNGVPFKLESAQTWVSRNVKKLSGVEKFSWIKSDSAAAVAKAKTRAAKTPAAETAAPAAMPKIQSTIDQLRKALVMKEKANRDLFINQIPSGKIPEFEKAYAAFILTIETILA